MNHGLAKHTWGGLLDGLGRYEESQLIYVRALAIYEERFGPDHFEVAACLNNLGLVGAVQGDVAEARALLQRSLVMKGSLFGGEHPEVELAKRNLCEVEKGRFGVRRELPVQPFTLLRNADGTFRAATDF